MRPTVQIPAPAGRPLEHTLADVRDALHPSIGPVAQRAGLSDADERQLLDELLKGR